MRRDLKTKILVAKSDFAIFLDANLALACSIRVLISASPTVVVICVEVTELSGVLDC